VKVKTLYIHSLINAGVAVVNSEVVRRIGSRSIIVSKTWDGLYFYDWLALELTIPGRRATRVSVKIFGLTSLYLVKCFVSF
jgi:hypothetical protein